MNHRAALAADPLHAKVTGMFLLPASRFTNFPGTKKQDKIKICDAEWLAPNRLLLLEDVHTDLQAMGISPAKVTQVFSTKLFPEIDSDKLEGLALLSPDKIALANDNDFGIGENPNGEPSRIWILRVPALLAFEH